MKKRGQQFARRTNVHMTKKGLLVEGNPRFFVRSTSAGLLCLLMVVLPFRLIRRLGSFAWFRSLVAKAVRL
jgi:hypothetical protein